LEHIQAFLDKQYEFSRNGVDSRPQLALHGTRKWDRIPKIFDGNFHDFRDSFEGDSFQRLDRYRFNRGYFGNGNYFAFWNIEHLFVSDAPVVLSLVLPGKTHFITHEDKGYYNGMPLRSGYDSHYVGPRK